ncbi:alpha/beta fold hydrolase [Geothrix fermentans]|uniref:alpha/beta fold hydrolase n=1 Tax=Geothrix fermentans TaxID=44676 RepID=UPI00041255F4|nr:alpha/beta hydrolase [Geothrix fermentans]
MPLPARERPLLVLLPGLDGTGLMFGPFVAALEAAGFEARVVRYPPALVSHPACAHFARTLLPRDRPFLLLGESFSGPVALALAAEPPDNLVALVLCGTFARNPRPGLGRLAPLLPLLPGRLPLAAVRFLLLGRWATEPLMDLARTLLPQVPPATMKARLRAVVAVDQTPLLGRMRMPVLALVATGDRLVPPSATAWLRAHLPNLDISRLQGPHWLLQARPGACVQAISAFLARLPKPAEAAPGAEEVEVGGQVL